jgi:hypothetical protein
MILLVYTVTIAIETIPEYLLLACVPLLLSLQKDGFSRLSGCSIRFYFGSIFSV